MTTLLIPQGYTFTDLTVGSGVSLVEGELVALTLGDLAGNMRVTQDSRNLFTAYWDLVAPVDVDLFRADSELVFLGHFPAATRWHSDPYTESVVGQFLTYLVVDQQTSALLQAGVAVSDPDVPNTFGAVDPLVEVIRYTTLDTVKARLGITHTEADLLLTSAVISAEVAIDQFNGRSFPDTGANPEIVGVPEAIRTWATDASIAIWKAADAPFGQGGGDAWLGALDIQTITERVLRRHPLSLGYKVSFGIA